MLILVFHNKRNASIVFACHITVSVISTTVLFSPSHSLQSVFFLFNIFFFSHRKAYLSLVVDRLSFQTIYCLFFFSVHQHEHSVVKRKWLSNVCTSIAQKAYFLLLQFTKVFFSIFGEEKKVQGNLYLLVKKEMDLFKAEKKIRWKVVQLSHFFLANRHCTIRYLHPMLR